MERNEGKYCERHKDFSVIPEFGKKYSVHLTRSGDYTPFFPVPENTHIQCPQCRKEAKIEGKILIKVDLKPTSEDQ